MPELPEVELYARYFAKHAMRQRIARVRVLDERVLGDIRKAQFVRRLTGRTFTAARRHGKHLFVEVEGDTWLHLHFGMTGDLAYYRNRDAPRFARVVFDFENGAHLAYEDMRLFGTVDLTHSPDEFISDHRLGPDPLNPGFGLRHFRRLLRERRGSIKALLMSQDVIAGLGNLYVDDMLFRASIDPRRPADRLMPAEIKAIYTAMRRVLSQTIEFQRRGFLVEHREEGDRCPRCGGTIQRSVVAGRTTYSCSTHQA